ncbi:MAG: uroporphyrinogen-III synthase [Gammaproteobacteria bacterium]|nr:uroporphyrinogen-III synthase [Gammaproteobacteria bacterium]MCP5459319.1 uroporphyrinogen-III synthase [Gammaproteobacteria bacterium]
MPLPPTSALPLHGMGILVTRPARQADGLCRLIGELGGRPWRFPVLEILPTSDPAPALTLIDRLETYDLAIFISANAVYWGLELIRGRRSLDVPPRRVAIGQATARALAEQGAPAHVLPPHFTSEELLALPEMQTVAGLRIIIFRGEGGRDLLKDTLLHRGAQVEYAEVYRRVRPAAQPTALLRDWRQGGIHAVIVTSNESLENLYTLIGTAGRHRLLDTNLIVLSPRTQRLARELGFRRLPRLAEAASDEAIVQALLRMASDSIQTTCGDPL